MDKKREILSGYNSAEKSFKVDDYPYGFTLRTSIFYWIESKLGKGDRFCSQTINPKNGKRNAPKYSTYSPCMFMYLNEKGHVTHGIIDPQNIDEFERRFGSLISDIGLDNLTEIQKSNILTSYWLSVNLNSLYEVEKYKESQQEEYNHWARGKLEHIQKCNFRDLVKYAPKPTPIK